MKKIEDLVKDFINEPMDEWYQKKQAEREKRNVGKTDEEIRILDLQERIDGLNSKPGELTGYDCPKCKNRGYYYVMPPDIKIGEVTVYCECGAIRRSIRLLEASGLSEAFRSRRFDTYTTAKPWQKAMKEFAEEYANAETNEWFILSGQSGCGKTHLCTAIANSFLAQNKNVIYLPYRDDIPKLKRHATDDIFYSKQMDTWQTAPILYIDDLFKKHTTADIGIMFELLDYRARNNLCTMISTELTFTELLEIDEAVAGRILENCGKWKMQIEKDKKKNYRIKELS